MATIAPLTPLLYDLSRYAGRMADVVAPPYDVISPTQRAELAREPHNVVRLILPEGEGDTKYENARVLFEQVRKENVLVRDEKPGFYLYEQTFAPPGGGAPITRRGFLGLVKVVPFSDRVVLPHERTLSGPKEDRLKLFRATCTNLSPGFMLYRDRERALEASFREAKKLATFRTADGIEHALSKVEGEEAIRGITAFMKDKALLIADGHHRYETALRYAQEAAAAHPSMSERARARYFMVFFANEEDPNLMVFPTHRHVHGLASPRSFDEMCGKLESLFRIDTLAGDAASLVAQLAESKTPAFVACGAKDRDQVLLSLRADADLGAHPVLGSVPEALRKTDVMILHGAVLEEVLGITKEAQAAKTNLWYPQDATASLAALRAAPNPDGAAPNADAADTRGDFLFLMNATPVSQVRAVAEAGEVMPQKSTFFYPKVLTGLAIHTLEHDVDV